MKKHYISPCCQFVELQSHNLLNGVSAHASVNPDSMLKETEESLSRRSSRSIWDDDMD